MQESMTILSSMTITNGTLDTSASNFAIGVVNDWNNTGGTFVVNQSTVTFTGTTGTSGSPHHIQSGAANSKQPFWNVTFNGSGGYWTLQDSMTVTSSMTITNGTLDTSASNFDIGGANDWKIANASFRESEK